MSLIAPVSVVGDILETGSDDFYLITDAAFVKGELVRCPVNSDGTYTTCSAPTAASLGTPDSAIVSDGVFGIVLVGAASGGRALVRLRGEVEAYTLSSADASFTTTSGFIGNTSKQLELDMGNSQTNMKILALCIAAVDTTSIDTTVPTLRTVWFNGIEGFGRWGGSTS